MEKVTLGFSSCPNDTFIFNALVNGKIDTEGLTFDLFIGDVEELNRKAFKKELDITKLSFNAFGFLTEEYLLLDSGSALGRGCGPLLIAKGKFNETELSNLTIAIPGQYTTANFLLQIAFPHICKKKEMIFSAIEDAVVQGEVDAGVIIHENRFTYQEKGLIQIIDLGEFWEKKTGLPIPLGGIVVKRSLPTEIQLKVNRLIRKSVEFALANPEDAMPYITKYSQEMDEKVVRNHINLYVNDYSVSLGTEGREAVTTLFQIAREKKIITSFYEDLFLSKSG